MAATARMLGRSSGGGMLIARALMTLLMLVPVLWLFVATRDPATDQRTRAGQELLGVDYLRALQPLTAALLAAQATAVAGSPVDGAALTQAYAAVDNVDGRVGATLGVRDRWKDLRAKIQGLPAKGSPRAVYVAYGEASELLLALYGRLQHTSGLATDPWADTFSLQQVVAVDLPQIIVGIGRYADLAQVIAGDDVSVPELAELLSQRQSIGRPGADLVESLGSAVASTESVTLSANVLGELDAMRQALDAVSGASGPTANRQTAGDVAAANTVRSNAITPAAALSTKVLNALAELLSQRRDAAAATAVRANLALAGGIALVIVHIGLELAVWVRRRRSAPSGLDDLLGEPTPSRAKERVGVAR